MKTNICIPIVEKTIDKAKSMIIMANAKADVIELRLDFLESVDAESLVDLIAICSKPVIITPRIDEQGGAGNLNDNNRCELLKLGFEKNVEYVDIEYESAKQIQIVNSTKVIVSHHDFAKTPAFPQMLDIVSDMKQKPGDHYKYITKANSINDNFNIFRLLSKQKNMISFCMGEKGQISRILAGKYGSFITFAALSQNQQSAPGQVDFDELIGLYNFDRIDKNTEIFGLIGQFAENSKSKYMHNPVFKNNNINAVFLPFKVEPGNDLKVFIENFRDFDFHGCAVTIPHKESIIPFLDKLDDRARIIRAVNTIKNHNGKIVGYNTDCIGAMRALKNDTVLTNKRVLVFGAGGAARAIVFGLQQEGAKLCIANRTFDKAQKLAKEFSVASMDINSIVNKIDDFDIFINATSVGMYPDINNSILEYFPKNALAMDIVYKPLKTKFLQIAEKCGCKIITGDKMLIWQAIEQQKIWTCMAPEFQFMQDAFNKIKE